MIWNFFLLTFKEGCLSKLKMRVGSRASILITVGLSVAFIQLLGIILACWLASSIRREAAHWKWFNRTKFICGIRLVHPKICAAVIKTIGFSNLNALYIQIDWIVFVEFIAQLLLNNLLIWYIPLRIRHLYSLYYIDWAILYWCLK